VAGVLSPSGKISPGQKIIPAMTTSTFNVVLYCSSAAKLMVSYYLPYRGNGCTVLYSTGTYMLQSEPRKDACPSFTNWLPSWMEHCRQDLLHMNLGCRGERKLHWGFFFHFFKKCQSGDVK